MFMCAHTPKWGLDRAPTCTTTSPTRGHAHVPSLQEVQSMQFNILVTTYETIMRDRTKLSKLEWKYIIIDEAQRMKDRQEALMLLALSSHPLLILLVPAA